MSYVPILGIPPAAHSYHYEGQDRHEPSQAEIRTVEHKLGSCINSDYEKGSKMTPAQKKRWVAISVAAASILFGVGAIVAACATAILPIMFVAIPLFGAAVGTGIYACVIKDFDSPQYRAKLAKENLGLSLKSLDSKHPFDRVLGYDLLNEIVPPYAATAEQRIEFYAKYKGLVHELHTLDAWHDQEISRVSGIYNRAVAPLNSWRDHHERIEQQGRIIRHQGHMMLDQARYHDRERTGRRKPVLDALSFGSAVGNVVADIGSEMTMARVNQMYGETVAPWNQWQSKEIRSINLVYQNALSKLEDQFDLIKQIA